VKPNGKGRKEEQGRNGRHCVVMESCSLVVKERQEGQNIETEPEKKTGG
jgi:hypothetical protein